LHVKYIFIRYDAQVSERYYAQYFVQFCGRIRAGQVLWHLTAIQPYLRSIISKAGLPVDIEKGIFLRKHGGVENRKKRV